MDQACNAIRSEFVRITDDFTIHVEESGNGDMPIVFIPGWTMSTKVFGRQLAHFRDSNCWRAMSYDPRGQGLTTKTIEGHSYQQHGRDLGAFIAVLGLKRVVLVGWSYGVLDAMAYLDQFGTDNVRAIVILDGTPKPTGKDPTKEWAETEESRQWGTITPIEDRATFHREFAQGLLEDASPENIDWITEISAQTSAAVTALLNETARHVDYEQLLIDVTKRLPVLVVAREEWREQVSGWLKANASEVPLVVLGKHMMFWERAEAFNAELAKFLDALE
jgi:non-heme chloroperoxidase